MNLTPSRQARLYDAEAALTRAYQATMQQPDLASRRDAALTLRFATMKYVQVIDDLDAETRAEALRKLETV